MPADLPSVRPGQIWADNDKRGRRGRRLTVERVVQELGGKPLANPYAVVRSNITGRTTNVRLDRFRPNSTGYRLLTEAPESAPEASDAR